MGQNRAVIDFQSLASDLISNENIKSTTTIDAGKVEHVHKCGTNFDLAIGATPVAREEIVFVASVACSIRGFYCLLNDTGTSTDVDYTLKKNGVSILSSAVNITHGTSDRAVQAGTLSSSTLAAGDVLSIELSVTSSTGAQGPFAWCEIDEKAS